MKVHDLDKQLRSDLKNIETVTTITLELLQSLENVANYEESDLKKLNGAKTSIESFSKIEALIGTIHRQFKDYETAVIKNWLKILRKIHPEVDENIKDLLYFKPISDEIGSRTLGYYPDTQSLDLEDWGTDKPKPIRYNIEYKINKNDLDNINNSYKLLNQAMVRNLSTEFTEERKANYNHNEAHDYHIAGDSTYSERMKETSLINLIEQKIKELLEDSYRLITYLNVISNYGEAVKGPIEIEINGKYYEVGLKGNPYQKQITAINNSPLIPVKN